jgi:hypothetical protein
MLNVQLPSTRYNKTIYPNLEDRADGAPIPLAYGNLHGVIPVCVDTVAKTYKVAGHAIHSIDELRTDTETLIASDFVADLPNGELSLDPGITPYVESGSTYYFVLEASYAPDPVNYVKIGAWEVTPAGDIDSWEIDNAGAWTEHNTHSISYQIFGKDALDQPEKLRLDYSGANPGTPAITIALGDANARTRVAQKFIPLSSFYVTRIYLNYQKAGTPSGTIRVAILSAKNPPGEIQVGTKSITTTVKTAVYNYAWMNFPQRAPEVSALFADIEGAEKSGATIIDGPICLKTLS